MNKLASVGLNKEQGKLIYRRYKKNCEDNNFLDLGIYICQQYPDLKGHAFKFLLEGQKNYAILGHNEREALNSFERNYWGDKDFFKKFREVRTFLKMEKYRAAYSGIQIGPNKFSDITKGQKSLTFILDHHYLLSPLFQNNPIVEPRVEIFPY